MVAEHSRASLGKFFTHLLDCLYPHTCVGCGIVGFALCEECQGSCNPFFTIAHPEWGTVESMYSYDSPMIQRVVHVLKQQRLPRAACLLIATAQNRFHLGTCFIPVPISRRRLAERGYNQSRLLAQELAQCTGGFVAEHALIRVGVNRQRGRSRDERLQADLGIRAGLPIAGSVQEYVLVDDVYTTGATLQRCASVLSEQGIVVSRGITLAYAP